MKRVYSPRQRGTIRLIPFDNRLIREVNNEAGVLPNLPAMREDSVA